MKRFIIATTLIAAFILSLAISLQSAHAKKDDSASSAAAKEKTFTSSHRPNGAPYSFAGLAEKLLPSVVNIATTQKTVEEDFRFPELHGMPDFPGFPGGSPFEEFFEQFTERRGGHGPTIPSTAQGSGFVIEAQEGYIVTNSHVILDAQEVRITFHDDVTLLAEVIGRDEKTDLAVLKIIPNDKYKDKKLTAAKFGNSDNLRVGDWILAIGNPFGLGGTVTAGIISARQRNINSGPYDDYLQTDASINRGNSGGPMFDLQGNVIGINTAIFSPTGGSVGIGFAIPSSLAKPVINQIIKYGHTRRGWLGVRIQTVTTEIAESLGLSEPSGALVASVTKGGPAEKSGLKAGDIILGFNGEDIPDMRDLPRIVAETKIESKAELTYWRDGKEHTAKVKIGELEKAEQNEMAEGKEWVNPNEDEDLAKKGEDFPEFGMRLDEITPENREMFDIRNDIEGLVILQIKNDAEAAQKGLIEGDVIIEINQKPVLTTKAAKKALKEAKKNNRDSVLILLSRAGDIRFIALKMHEQ